MYKIIFFGTGDFAVPSLTALVKDTRFNVTAVVTQPDRPFGRHATVTPPPVKVAATAIGITDVHQPEKLKDSSFQEWTKNVGPSCDAFVVVSYGKILPQWLLDLPKKGVMNVHGSLLPRWRGPSPIQTAIAAGDAKTGVTIMKLDAEMDHGPMLATSETVIRFDDTAQSLHDRLAGLGSTLLTETLAGYLADRLHPVEQDHAQATACKILTRDDGKIDWTHPANEIERQVRAYNPWPGCWTLNGGKRLKIHKSAVIDGDAAFKPGQCFVFEKLPAVACGDGTALLLLLVQPEGRAVMDGYAYLAGISGWENLSLS
ncbi:MAG TPA: methionyl-tRNA formyltransferase [Candidatus Methylomirabilis sp.]|nr:methionyl-tRNA formyltransferase [Candidatus Methylomirabilis sp.]